MVVNCSPNCNPPCRALVLEGDTHRMAMQRVAGVAQGATRRLQRNLPSEYAGAVTAGEVALGQIPGQVPGSGWSILAEPP